VDELMDGTSMSVELIKYVIDGNTLVLQEGKPIIFPQIISWVHTINGDRIVVSVHLPGHGGDMVYIVKMSDKKQVHVWSHCGRCWGRSTRLRMLQEIKMPSPFYQGTSPFYQGKGSP
jgi:hypothetical protein